MFFSDFLINLFARRAASSAVPWASQQNKCVCEKLFFHFFLGDFASLRESLFRDQRQPLRAKNSNEKPNK